VQSKRSTQREAQRRTRMQRYAALLVFVAASVMPNGVGAQVTLVLTPGSTMGTLAGSGADAKTIAGTAASAALGSPQGIAYDAAGNLYIADARNHQVTRVDTAGQLALVAGTGRQGFAGDGGPARTAELNAPTGIAFDASGNVYIADTGNQRVRHIATDGTIATVAGTGIAGFSGDGGAATVAQLRTPSALAIDSTGALYIADTGNHRVRKLLPNGTITTVAGSGNDGDDGDGGAALLASFEALSGLALLPDGRLLMADRAAHRIRSLNTDGTLSAYSPGPTLTLRRPTGLASDAMGTVSTADAANQQVLQSSVDGGSTLAGSGEQGAFTAGAPSATALDTPSAVAVKANGELAVSDRRNHQVQRMTLASLVFGNVPAGSSSAAQTVTLRNGGATTLQVLAIGLPGSFALTAGGTCGLAPFILQADTQCTVAILFAPTAQGSADAVGYVRINGAAPQSLLLTGSGTANGTLASSITSLRSDGSIDYAGAPVTLTATVAGSLLHAPAGNVTFMDGSSPLAMVALVNGTVSFSTPGLQTGQHTLQAIYSGDAVYSTSTSAAVSVTVVPSPDFTFAASAKSYSGNAGGNIVVPMTLVPVNGTLNHTIQLAATGLPTGATATFSPAMLTLGGDSVSVTMTIQLPATVAQTPRSSKPYLPIACALFMGLLLYRKRRVRALMCVFMAIGLGGCGSGFRAGVTVDTLTGATTQTSITVITATTTGVLGAPLSHSSSVALVISK
jgi:hypothetical protein